MTPAELSPDDFQRQLDERFMREALKQAQMAADADEVPVGAVVVAGGKIIGRGHNQVEKLFDATAHAEMLAITAAAGALSSKYLTDCTLYVTLEPCPMCAGALRWAQMGRVVFGASDVKNGYKRFGDMLHPKTERSEGVLHTECAALMVDFFRAKRR